MTHRFLRHEGDVLAVLGDVVLLDRLLVELHHVIRICRDDIEIR